MAIESNRIVFQGFIVLVLVLLLLVGAGWWMNRGYGEVSPMTYEFSKALYSACLTKSNEHLTKVKKMLDEADENSIPSSERRWIEKIIESALRGQWQTAAQKAKRMMEDQVRY